MAKSKKIGQLLEPKLAWLKHQLSGIDSQLRGISPMTQDEQGLRFASDLEREKALIGREIEDIEFQLHPPKGRGKRSRNKQPKPVDPAIAAALSEWESLAASKSGSERTIAGILARKHCPAGEARGRFAERLRAAWRSGNRAR